MSFSKQRVNMKTIVFLNMLLFSNLALAGNQGANCFDELFARQDIAVVVNKLTVAAQTPATFEQLSNTEKATDAEKPLIAILADGTNKCHQVTMDEAPKNMPFSIRNAYDNYQNNRMILLIDVYNQKISYGEYMQRRQLAKTKMEQDVARGNQEISDNEATSRQLEQEQIERDMAVFRENTRRSSPKTTNCTSTRLGNTVQTNCR
jgi:hypothetical protein